jgi:hypothetical protein
MIRAGGEVILGCEVCLRQFATCDDALASRNQGSLTVCLHVFSLNPRHPPLYCKETLLTPVLLQGEASHSLTYEDTQFCPSAATTVCSQPQFPTLYPLSLTAASLSPRRANHATHHTARPSHTVFLGLVVFLIRSSIVPEAPFVALWLYSPCLRRSYLNDLIGLRTRLTFLRVWVSTRKSGTPSATRALIASS